MRCAILARGSTLARVLCPRVLKKIADDLEKLSSLNCSFCFLVRSPTLVLLENTSMHPMDTTLVVLECLGTLTPFLGTLIPL